MTSESRNSRNGRTGWGRGLEKKLQTTLSEIGVVSEVKLLNTSIGEYGVELTNGRRLVVNLSWRACSCKWWQLRELPCLHGMAVIENQKLWLYDLVDDCYKASTQGRIYLNSIHPMETHDSTEVDDGTGMVIGGEELDDGFNRRILPPNNP